MIVRAFAAAIATLALALPAPAGAGAPLRIGAIVSSTGAYAPLGEPEARALRVAVADINAHGGVGGRPLEIEIQDDEGKPDTAAQLAQQYVGKGYPIVIGGTLTATSSAIARVTSAAGVVQIYMTPTPSLWDTRAGVARTIFEVSPRDELQTRALLDFAYGRLRVTKLGILHDENEYGNQGATLLWQRAGAMNIAVVGNDAFPGTATDATGQLLKLKAAAPDVIVIWGTSPSVPLIVRQIRQLGIAATIMGPAGILTDSFLRVSGPSGNGVFSVSNVNYTHPNEPQRAFLAAFRAAYHAKPVNFASFAWDAAHLAAYALGHASKPYTGMGLAHVLETMPIYAGSTAMFHFSETDHNGMATTDLHLTIDRNGVWFNL